MIRSQSPVFRYISAIALPALALILSLLLRGAIGPSFLLTFTLAVFVVAWFYGLGPGLVATTTSLLIAHFLISVVGLHEFTAAHGLKMTRTDIIRLAVAWLPYQLVLAYAAGRAVARQMRGISNWEKTAHVGAHRGPSSEAAEDVKELVDDAA